MRRLLAALCAALLLALTACTPRSQTPERHELTYLDVFDTVTTLVAYGGTGEDFSAEAGRILGLTPAEVDSKRAECVLSLTAKTGQALLKGRNTLVASSEELRMIAAGSPSLAVPGSGDVLSGIIGAFIAAGIPIADAATAGALAHGLAGEALEARLGVRGALAGEIADEIPAVLK